MQNNNYADCRYDADGSMMCPSTGNPQQQQQPSPQHQMQHPTGSCAFNVGPSSAASTSMCGGSAAAAAAAPAQHHGNEGFVAMSGIQGTKNAVNMVHAHNASDKQYAHWM